MIGLPIHAQSALAAAKARPPKEKTPLAKEVEPQLLPGVVVEKVEKNSEAEKAGLHEGDVLLSWSRGDEQGKIESPFDVAWLDIEQRPRGTVTLYGTRGSQPFSSTMRPIFWLLNVIPRAQGRLRRDLQESQRLVAAGKVARSAGLLDHVAREEKSSLPAWLRAWLFARSADEWIKLGRLNQAEALYQQAEAQALKCDRNLNALLRIQAGDAFSRKSGWPQTERFYQEALSSVNSGETETLISAKALTRLGSMHLNKGNPSRAAEYYLQALHMLENLVPGQIDVAVILDVLGQTAAMSGELSLAETYSRRVHAIEDGFEPDNRWIASGFTLEGTIAFYRGDLEKSEQSFRRAFEITKNTASPDLMNASLLTYLGLVQYLKGDFALAASEFRWALAIHEREAPETLTMSTSMIDLAIVLRDTGDFAGSQKLLHHAMFIVQKSAPESRLMSQVLNALGISAERDGDFAGAEAYLLRAVEIEQHLGPVSFELADKLFDLGEFFVKRGNLVKGEKYYRSALTIQESACPGSKMLAETLAALAGIYRQKNDLPQAADLFEKALAALDSQTSRLGGSQSARSDFRAQYTSFYRDYVDILVAQNKPDLAFHTLERSRSRTLLEMLSSAHIDFRLGAESSLVARERLLQADIGAKSARRIHLMSEEHDQKQYKEIEKEIADLLAQYQDVETQIRATSPAYAALTQPQPLTAKEVQTQLLDPATLLLEYSLGEERSYVFTVTPDSLQAFELPKRALIEKSARRVYSLLTARNVMVKGETDALKQTRIARTEVEYLHAAAQLSHMILGPVASQLQNKRLLIVADGALAYVPFSILPEPQPANATITTIATAAKASSSTPATTSPASTPLMVNHEIVNLPSASVLAVLRQQELGRKPAPKAVAVLADPVFDRHDLRLASKLAFALNGGSAETRSLARNAHAPRLADDPLPEASSSLGLLTRSAADIGLTRNGELRLPRLPFSRREADEIMAVTPEGEGKKAVDFDASRATATSPELSQYRIVHFATHGLLDSVHPELSGLVFSMVDKNGQPQNGFLELQDIYNLNLPADLVVLSACETGLGKEISGEGLVGLTRGFMYAGASRVMASLWKVSDAGTAALMAEFYRSMEKDSLPPAAALRAAQIKMWQQKRWRDPYYWAAFQLQGEWK
jgi:CHAT domain-containing protein/Flp pilus assembly protein TadD